MVTGQLTQSPLFSTADEIREAIPHAEAATIDGQGHMAASFAPDRFAHTVLTFTADHDR